MNLFTKPNAIELAIGAKDITSMDADVLAIPYSSNVDGFSSKVLETITRKCKIYKNLSEGYIYGGTCSIVKTNYVLLLNTPSISKFNYRHVREFSSNTLRMLSEHLPYCKHLLMVIHGAEYGLDEIESAFAQLGGILDAMEKGDLPNGLERISMISNNRSRIRNIRSAFENSLGKSPYVTKLGIKRNLAYLITAKLNEVYGYDRYKYISKSIKTAGIKSESKESIFVAMPFRKDMYDLFRFGISQPIRKRGFLAERIDQQKYTGTVLERIKKEIDDAKLIVAVLTGSNPNVYLEVGYAWGKKKPTVLLIKKGEKPEFDLIAEKYIEYETISEVEELLKSEINEFKEKGFKDF
jgi:hypothetical protein